MPEKVREFQGQAVLYVETTRPNDDVECDVYTFEDDATLDLAIVQVKPFGKTPRQRVLLGEQTLEGYMSGRGVLSVNGESHVFPRESTNEVEVVIGDVMQWQASDEGLVFYEVCTPSYVDGRFEDITS